MSSELLIPELLKIPETLNEAISAIEQFPMRPDQREWAEVASEDEFVAQTHHGIGRWIRNTWGLWEGKGAGSALVEWFNARGITHPDDMSGIILTSFWRKLHGEPEDLDGQVKKYKDYWAGYPGNGTAW